MIDPSTLLALRPRTAALGGLALCALAGCLSVPDGPTPMCASTSDCDSYHGEVCEEGTCWGNPPLGMFAAVISPPSARPDLVTRELPGIALRSDGWMGDLALDRPVSFNGRIVAYCPPPMTGCETTTLGATVAVSRRSQFQGGPGFKAIINVEGGADSFSIPVPATGAIDDPYTVTISPDPIRPLTATSSAAERVPPRRTQISVGGSLTMVLELGGPDLPVISGTLTNELGQGLAGYRVAALGRWDPTEPVTEVSTVDFTDGATGNYAVTLSADLVGTVELVAQPTMPDAVAPTLHLANIDATRSSTKHDAVATASLGVPINVPFTVTGVDLNGAISKVRGAVVSVSGTFTSGLTSFTVNDQQVTDKEGTVMLHLLDGAGFAGKYRLSITPPASSTLSAVFDQKITLPVVPPVQLISRIALRGIIVDSERKPLNNVAVTARPSLRFLWTLDTGPQAFVAGIPAATTVTPESGVFVLWVDANIAQTWGHYDLMIEPPTTSLAPTYIKADTDFPRDSRLDAFDLGVIELPSAAYIHGQISGSDGQPVENAELRLYRVDTQLDLCSEVAHAPSSCPIPAQLQGRNTSDDKGAVRLVLPR